MSPFSKIEMSPFRGMEEPNFHPTERTAESGRFPHHEPSGTDPRRSHATPERPHPAPSRSRSAAGPERPASQTPVARLPARGGAGGDLSGARAAQPPSAGTRARAAGAG